MMENTGGCVLPGLPHVSVWKSAEEKERWKIDFLKNWSMRTLECVSDQGCAGGRQCIYPWEHSDVEALLYYWFISSADCTQCQCDCGHPKNNQAAPNEGITDYLVRKDPVFKHVFFLVHFCFKPCNSNKILRNWNMLWVQVTVKGNCKSWAHIFSI